MAEKPENDESASSDVEQNVSGEDVHDSDSSNTCDMIESQDTVNTEGCVEKETEEEKTDQVDTQEQPLQNNDEAPKAKKFKKYQRKRARRKMLKENGKIPYVVTDNVDWDAPVPVQQHPCKDLLRSYQPRRYDLTTQEEYPLRAIAETPCIWVDTEQAFNNMIEQLMCEKEIGIVARYKTDNYWNVLCVMLISTKDTNYMIDCLALESHLHLLNPVFLNPSIVKVMDGNRLMRNLQIDHKMWFVNIFDLKLAFKKLNMPVSYFQYIDSKYNNNDKKNYGMYLCRWNTRPLPDVFHKTALMLMHYLIPVYCELKNCLVDADLIRPFLETCNKECGLAFRSKLELEDIMPDIAYVPANQAATLQELHAWRHRFGRKRDTNINNVINNKYMVALARKMPTTSKEILKVAKGKNMKGRVPLMQKIIVTCKKVIGPINMPPGWGQHTTQPMFDDMESCDRSRGPNNTAEGRFIFKNKYALVRNPQNGKFENRNEVPSGNHGPFEGNSDDRFGNCDNKGTADHHRGYRNRFMDHEDEPRAKRPRTGAWNRRQPWSRDRSPSLTDRPDSSTNYMIASDQRRYFPVDNPNMLTRTDNLQRESSGCWQNNSQNNGPIWDSINSHQSMNLINSINTLVNISSSLMNMNRHGTLDDCGSRDRRGNECYVPNRSRNTTKRTNWRDSIRPSPLSDRYIPSLSDHTSTRGSYTDRYPDRSQRSNDVWSHNQSRSLDIVSYPSRSRNPYSDAYPDQSRNLDTVSYPRYNASRYSNQGF